MPVNRLRFGACKGSEGRASMTGNAKGAFEKLKSHGVPVRDWGEAEGYGPHSQFVIISKSQNGDEVFADQDGNWIKEASVNGIRVNPLGIRHDIHEVLAEHNLATDWASVGQVVVYDANEREVAGYHHTARSPEGAGETITPEMSPSAFEAFIALARIGAPIEDWHDHLNRDPAHLPRGTQFVMQRSPTPYVEYSDEFDSEDGEFSKTGGLHPEVYEIANTHGLKHVRFVRTRKGDRFPPKDLIAFIDPRVPSRG